MQDSKISIRNVSDTALWVAYYRAIETDRADALFRDPFAHLLIGDLGKKIAESVPHSSKYAQLNVIMRTLIIDRMIESLIAKGVDTILNLGAGLDTRPYRLQLPSNFLWIEVDYPHIIELKQRVLGNEKPSCQLTQISLDLSQRESRQKLFADISAQSSRVCILTEGVLPYLTQSQVEELSEDLRNQKNFLYWIADYISPKVYKYLLDKKRAKAMQNAPFQFFPTDWLKFFQTRGWKLDLLEYIPEEALKQGREIPMPWPMAILSFFLSENKRAKLRQSSGYMLLELAPFSVFENSHP